MLNLINIIKFLFLVLYHARSVDEYMRVDQKLLEYNREVNNQIGRKQKQDTLCENYSPANAGKI